MTTPPFAPFGTRHSAQTLNRRVPRVLRTSARRHMYEPRSPSFKRQ